VVKRKACVTKKANISISTELSQINRQRLKIRENSQLRRSVIRLVFEQHNYE